MAQRWVELIDRMTAGLAFELRILTWRKRAKTYQESVWLVWRIAELHGEYLDQRAALLPPR
jgi:hypothetical protein